MIELEKGGQSKPLRPTSNKIKDIYNTYKKGHKEINIPIKDAESEKMEVNETIGINRENQMEENFQDNETLESNDLQKELEDKINELTKERDDFKEKLLRSAAEMENLRRRTNKEKQEMLEYGNERLLFKLLEILDLMEKAIESGGQSSDYDALYNGIVLIYQKAAKLFEDSGVKRMDVPIGQEFNVDFHDAVMHIPSEAPEGQIVHEVQAGYTINDKVLRHAKVVTSAGQGN
jgi:molecular chaperone GrpE